MKTVLVTGASGFIGQRCLPLLVAAGLEVHAVARVPVMRDNTIHWHEADLLSAGSASKLVRSLQPKLLLHLAWTAKPGEFWSSPDNLRWLSESTSLVGAFFASGGERAVGAGTCAEYAWGEQNLSESSGELRPSTVYGRCKLAASLAFAAAAQAHGARAAWARLFFPYGPGEPPQRFIPGAIEALLSATPLACTHGNQVRDFVHADDVAAALVTLLLSDTEGVFNVGTGAGSSLRQVADLIQARLGGAGLLEFGTRTPPPDDPPRVVADVTRITSETGWKPRITLEQGLDNMIHVLRQQKNLDGINVNGRQA